MAITSSLSINSPTDSSTSSLLCYFAGLTDPRKQYLIEHELLDPIAITICAVICAAETWGDIEADGHSKAEWLGTFLALPNGIPSHDTISRLFIQLDLGVCVCPGDRAKLLDSIGSIGYISKGVINKDG